MTGRRHGIFAFGIFLHLRPSRLHSSLSWHAPCDISLIHAVICRGEPNTRFSRRIVMQQDLTYMRRKAAAGWAFLVWLFGGGLGLAIVVFIVLKMMGG
jgi:hypothetical protein